MNVQHEAWVAQREADVWGAHGIAALAGTHWLDGQWRSFNALPGAWHSEDLTAIGDIGGRILSLRAGDEHAEGNLLLRGFARDGVVAVRVFDPAASTRRGISRIQRFPYDDALRVAGHFTPGAQTEASVAIDGHQGQRTHDGVVVIDEFGIRITVDRNDDGSLFATVADGTAGTESHPFRHLHLPAPDVDGMVDVDFNRLALPPCAFSDYYLCLLPSAGNRWSLPLRGGEARAV